MSTAAVNIVFGATVAEFVAGVRAMRAETSQFIAQLNTNLTAGYAAADRQQRVFDQGLGRVGGNMKAFGEKASVASAGLALLGGAAFKSYAEIDGLQRALTVTAGSTEEANKQFSEFRQLAKLPGLGLQEVTNAGLQLETLGYQAQTAEKYVSEVGNAIALGGKGKAEFGSVITQFTQMSGKARVLSEDLKPILNASPVISKAITDMFGTVDPEKISGILQAAGRGPKEFIDDLVKKLSTLERVTGGPKNALENLGDSFTIAGYETGKAADNAFGLTSKLDGLGTLVSDTATRFGTLPPGIQAVTFGLVGAAAAVGPLAVGIGYLISLGPQFVSGFGAIKTALLALLSPVGVVTIAIGAALAAFITLGLALSHYDGNLQTTTDRAKLFAEINGQVTEAIGAETSKLQSLLGVARDETISKKARESAIKDLNALSPEYLGNLRLETINTAEATNQINKYTTALRLKAKLQILNQQSADKEIELDRARAKSARDFVDRSRFSRDQIAINIKTVASFTPQADQDREFDKLGKTRKNAEVSRLEDAGRILNEEIKKAYSDAAKQNITLEAPKVKPFNYADFFNGSKSGIAAAKAELKKLADEIYADNKKGIDTTAKQKQYDLLKSQLKDQTAFTREVKTATEGVGSSLTTNERISKRLNQSLKEQGDNASESLRRQAAAFQELVDKGKTAVASLNKERIDIPVNSIGATVVTPSVPAALGVGLDPVVYQKTNAQVVAIVGNMQRIKALNPEVFKSADASKYLSAFQLAGPSLEAYRNRIEEIKATIATLTLNNIKVPPGLLAQLGELKKAVSDAFSSVGAADASTNSGKEGDVDAKYIAKAERRIARMKAAGKEYSGTAESLASDLKSADTAFVMAGSQLLQSIGDAFGKDKNPLTAALKSLTDILADFLIKQGEALALAALFGQAAAVAAGPFAFLFSIPTGFQLAAAGVLIGGGAALKSFGNSALGSYEGGGLFTGESFIRVGESARAIAGGGEFVAPVNLGADLIGDRILKTLKLNTPQINSQQASNLRPAYMDVRVGGEFELSGNNLRVSLARAEESFSHTS